MSGLASRSLNAKIKQILIAAVAVMSLFASSASACACSHHQEQENAETPSSHSHVHHEDASTEHAEAASTSFESLCECILAKPVPAIIAKSDKRGVSPQPDGAASELQKLSLEREMLFPSRSLKIDRSETTFLSKLLTGLLPARAPPRL